jgi:hypothetical protein
MNATISTKSIAFPCYQTKKLFTYTFPNFPFFREIGQPLGSSNEIKMNYLDKRKKLLKKSMLSLLRKILPTPSSRTPPSADIEK